MADIHITSIADLLAFANGSSGTGTSEDFLNVYLDKDLDFALDNGGAYANTDFAGCTGITGYCNFYGQNHTIKNISYIGAANWGFFPSLGSGSTVRDLYLSDLNVTTTAEKTGGIVASWGLNSYIINCHVQGVINGGQYVGGIVGVGASVDSSNRYIQYCTFSGNISGSYIGGIMGRNQGAGWRYSSTYIQCCGVRATLNSTNKVSGVGCWQESPGSYSGIYYSKCYFIGSLYGNAIYGIADRLDSASELYAVVESTTQDGTVNMVNTNVIYDNDVATTAGYTVTGGTPETSAHLKDATYMRTTYNWSA